MSVSGLNGLAQSRANAALQLLQAGGRDDASGEDADAPGLIQPNRGSRPFRSAAQTIRAILDNQNAADSASASAAKSAPSEPIDYSYLLQDENLSPARRRSLELDAEINEMNRPATVAEFKRLASDLLDPGDSLRLTISGRTYGVEGADRLSADELRFAVDVMTRNVLLKERTVERVETIIRENAARPDANAQARANLAALDNGTLELVPFEEFGVKYSSIYDIHVSKIGRSAFSNASTSDLGKLLEVREKMMVKQDDGTYIDPESGKYVTYIRSGERGFFILSDPPEAAAAA